VFEPRNVLGLGNWNISGQVYNLGLCSFSSDILSFVNIHYSFAYADTPATKAGLSIFRLKDESLEASVSRVQLLLEA
jgi:hypothetical protein